MMSMMTMREINIEKYKKRWYNKITDEVKIKTFSIVRARKIK